MDEPTPPLQDRHWLGTALSGAAVALAVAGIACAILLRDSSYRVPYDAGFGLALVITLLGVGAAVKSTALHYAVRHTYNLHYAILAAMIPLSWPLQYLLVVDDKPWLANLFAAGLCLSVPWTLAHLVASASGDRRSATLLAAGTTLASLALVRPGSIVYTVLLALGAALLPFLPGRRDQSVAASTRWGVTAFLLFNLITVAGLGVAITMLFIAVFTLGMDDTLLEGKRALEGSNLEFGLISEVPVLLKAEALRVGMSLVGLLLLPWAVFAWPQSRPGRLAIAGGVGCLVAAGLLGGQMSTVHAVQAFVPTVVLLVAATVLCTGVPRGKRWPHAVIASAVCASILLQTCAPRLYSPLLANVPFFAEGVYLAILWLIAYLFGLRVIRRREDPAPASPVLPASPARLAPPPVPAPR